LGWTDAVDEPDFQSYIADFVAQQGAFLISSDPPGSTFSRDVLFCTTSVHP
jgi:hypothetical protein